jgi:hypothetical protein
MQKPFLLLMAALIALVALFGFSAPTTQAASQTINLNFSGNGPVKTLVHAGAVCDPCLPDAAGILLTGDSASNSYGVGAEVDVTAQAAYNPAPAGVALNYNAGNLMHGKTLDLADTLTPQPGTITVNYAVTGTVGVYETTANCFLCDEGCGSLTFPCNGWFATPFTITAGPITDSDSVACTMPLAADGTRTCSGTHTITLIDTTLFGVVPVKVEIPIAETVKVNGTAVTSVRVAVVSGGPAIPNLPLSFNGPSPSTVADPISISCSQPAGVDLLYSLTNNAYTATSAPFSIGAGLTLDGISIFSFTLPGPDLGPIPMSAPDQQADLGPVLKNNVPPTANAGGPYSGVEGSPVTFDATGSTSVCGFSSLTMTWNFSDGGVAYGPSPQHTFVDNGVYSGLLTATDSDGNVATTTFSVTISNVNPTVDAGPDQQNDWGRTIFFHANGADAGAIDNGSLLYTWNFNDPFDPLGASGQDVTHVYSQPGTYHPVVTVVDKDGGTGTDSLTVTITKRDVRVSYLGGAAAQIGDTVALSASIVDEYGQPVVGRLVTFTLDGSPIGSALTNTFGIAQTSFIAATATGAHTIVASFAGDALYKPGASSGTSTNFSVSKASAIFTYLGGLNGSPSKPLVLTSKLLDQNGKPVAGKLVTMAVGSQSCSAITNPSGIASCTITKLIQKPGKYLLSLNFGGTADYNSAGLTAVFTIGNANG